jgi:hypothetical protein
VNFSKTNDLIRPLHGVNLGPLCYRGMVDLSAITASSRRSRGSTMWFG